LFGITAGRDIAESGARVRQTIEHSTGRPTSDRAELENAQWSAAGPIRRDLLERIAQQGYIGGTRRRRVEQVLRHWGE
jgi:hypothetical protein